MTFIRAKDNTFVRLTVSPRTEQVSIYLRYISGGVTKETFIGYSLRPSKTGTALVHYYFFSLAGPRDKQVVFAIRAKLGLTPQMDVRPYAYGYACPVILIVNRHDIKGTDGFLCLPRKSLGICFMRTPLDKTKTSNLEPRLGPELRELVNKSLTKPDVTVSQDTISHRSTLRMLRLAVLPGTTLFCFVRLMNYQVNQSKHNSQNWVAAFD